MLDNESVLSSDNASMPSLLDMVSDSDSIPDLEDDDTIIDLATDTRVKEAKAVIRRGVRQHTRRLKDRRGTAADVWRCSVN